LKTESERQAFEEVESIEQQKRDEESRKF